MEKQDVLYDVAIIGGGAAGLTAAVYCSRAQLKTILFEKNLVGGLATYTNEIENYPGFIEPVNGMDLMNKFKKQALKFGTEIKLTEISQVVLSGKIKCVETFRKKFYIKSIIIATGSTPRKTGSRNEEKFLYDKGISFCAVCDAALNTGKDVFVVGSGDAAIEEAVYLAKFARRVTVSVLHDVGIVDANPFARELAFNNSKIEFIWNSMIDSFNGDTRLDSLTLKDIKTGKLTTVKTDNCFLFIGYIPNTEMFNGQINLSKSGFILTNESMETNIPGVFAAGDVRLKSLYQIATAVGDGATAGYNAAKYIEESNCIDALLGASYGKLSILYIYSAINKESINLLHVIDELKKETVDTFNITALDIYKSQSLIEKLNIENKVPQLLCIKDDKIVKILTRIEKNSILDEINRLLTKL